MSSSLRHPVAICFVHLTPPLFIEGCHFCLTIPGLILFTTSEPDDKVVLLVQAVPVHALGLLPASVVNSERVAVHDLLRDKGELGEDRWMPLNDMLLEAICQR